MSKYEYMLFSLYFYGTFGVFLFCFVFQSTVNLSNFDSRRLNKFTNLKVCGYFLLLKVAVANLPQSKASSQASFVLLGSITSAPLYRCAEQTNRAHYYCHLSKHRPSGPMLSISLNIRVCVCVFVRVFTFEVSSFCPHFPKANIQNCQIFRILVEK